MNFWLILLCVFAGATVLWAGMNVLLFIAIGRVVGGAVNANEERKE